MTARLIVPTVLSAFPLDIGSYANTVCHFVPFNFIYSSKTRDMKQMTLSLTTVLGAPDGRKSSFSIITSASLSSLESLVQLRASWSSAPQRFGKPLFDLKKLAMDQQSRSRTFWTISFVAQTLTKYYYATPVIL